MITASQRKPMDPLQSHAGPFREWNSIIDVKAGKDYSSSLHQM